MIILAAVLNEGDILMGVLSKKARRSLTLVTCALLSTTIVSIDFYGLYTNVVTCH
jgi:hypothetical protein